jgi:hypothetical protein
VAAAVVDLEEYKAARIAALQCELDFEAATRMVGAKLVLAWADAVSRHADPTVAHLLELAAAIEDAIDADDALAELRAIADGAREAARTRARARR